MYTFSNVWVKYCKQTHTNSCSETRHYISKTLNRRNPEVWRVVCVNIFMRLLTILDELWMSPPKTPPRVSAFTGILLKSGENSLPIPWHSQNSFGQYSQMNTNTVADPNNSQNYSLHQQAYYICYLRKLTDKPFSHRQDLKQLPSLWQLHASFSYWLLISPLSNLSICSYPRNSANNLNLVCPLTPQETNCCY